MAVAVVMMKCFCVVPHCSALHYYYCSLCITVVLCVSRGYYIYSCGLYCCCYFPFVVRFGLFCHHSSIIIFSWYNWVRANMFFFFSVVTDRVLPSLQLLLLPTTSVSSLLIVVMINPQSATLIMIPKKKKTCLPLLNCISWDWYYYYYDVAEINQNKPQGRQ